MNCTNRKCTDEKEGRLMVGRSQMAFNLYSCGRKTVEDSFLGSTLQPSSNIFLSRLFHAPSPSARSKEKKSNSYCRVHCFFMRVTAGQNAYDFNCLRNVMSHAFSDQLHQATQVHTGNQESLFPFRAYANVIPGILSVQKDGS